MIFPAGRTIPTIFSPLKNPFITVAKLKKYLYSIHLTFWFIRSESELIFSTLSSPSSSSSSSSSTQTTGTELLCFLGLISASTISSDLSSTVLTGLVFGFFEAGGCRFFSVFWWGTGTSRSPLIERLLAACTRGIIWSSETLTCPLYIYRTKSSTIPSWRKNFKFRRLI